MNISETIRGLKQEHARDFDVVASPSSIDIDKNGRLIYQGTAYSFTRLSYRQWCNKIGVPHKFLASCPRGDGLATQKAIFDHFRQTHDSDVMFRLRRGTTETPNTVRAVLPGAYNIFDNDELLERLDGFIKESNMIVEDVKVKDGNLDLRLLYPKTIDIGKFNGEPDTHKFGYFLRNSEVGAIPDVRGNFLVYRNACTNGLVFSNKLLGRNNKRPLLSTSHVREAIDLIADLETSFITFENMAPRAKDALEQAQGNQLTLPQAERELNSLLDKLNIGEAFDASVAREFRKAPVFTRFGIAQALTASVRTAPVRTRSTVELAAGDYILSTIKR